MPVVAEVWAVLEPALAEMRAERDQPWEFQRERLLERLREFDDTVLGPLTEWLDPLPDQERAELIDSDRLAAEAYDIVRTHVPEDSTESTDAETYDEEAWNAYLAENGAAWDGTEDAWVGFRDWFLYYAAERGLTGPATALLDYLGGLPALQRVEAFAQYGVIITVAPPPAEPTPEQDALAAQIAEIPGVDQLTEEELTKILAEVAAETER